MKKAPKTLIILTTMICVFLTAIIYAANAPNPGHIGTEIKLDCPDGTNNIDLQTCLQNINQLQSTSQTISCPVLANVNITTNGTAYDISFTTLTGVAIYDTLIHNSSIDFPISTPFEIITSNPITINQNMSFKITISQNRSFQACIDHLGREKTSNIDVKIFCIGHSCQNYGYNYAGTIDHEGGHACWNPLTQTFVGSANTDDSICYKTLI